MGLIACKVNIDPSIINSDVIIEDLPNPCLVSWIWERCCQLLLKLNLHIVKGKTNIKKVTIDGQTL